MPMFCCDRCGLIFVREAPGHNTTICDHCLGRMRRGKLGRSVFDARDAPLFRALARDGQRAGYPRFMLGQPAGPGSILT